MAGQTAGLILFVEDMLDQPALRLSAPAEEELSTDRFYRPSLGQTNYLRRYEVTDAFNCLSRGNKKVFVNWLHADCLQLVVAPGV